MAPSSTTAEYVALNEAAKEAHFLALLAEQIGLLESPWPDGTFHVLATPRLPREVFMDAVVSLSLGFFGHVRAWSSA